MEIKCEFALKSWNNKMRYICYVRSADISKRNTRIAAIVGNHSPGNTNEDVDELYFWDAKVEYFPRGFGEIFPNLDVVLVTGCGLKELKKRDLVGLEGLTGLLLLEKHLESVPLNLLKNMKNLTAVQISSKMLKYIDSRMFDHIKHQLVRLTLQSYFPRINACYYQPPGISKTGRCHPNHRRSLKNDRRNVRRGEDFIIVVGKKEFKVHKNVLGMKSPVFAAMFRNDMEEKKSSRVIINDFSVCSVEEFLQFLYTGEIQDETNAMEVFALVCEYNVETSLKLEMEKTIVMNIDSENAIDVLKLGNLYDSEVLEMEAFDELKLANPEIDLSDDMMNKPEKIVEMFEAKLPRDQSIKKAEDPCKDCLF